MGCGAIGSSLAKIITRDFAGKAVISSIYDMDVQKARRLSNKLHKSSTFVAKDMDHLVKKADLVIEAASARVSAGIARTVLSKGRNIMVMSVGGIVADFAKLAGLAQKNNASIYIPSGAICGIDAIKALRLSTIKRVTLTTRKNPLSFKGVSYIGQKSINLGAIKKDTCLFDGPALDAIKYFPQNINVAAVLSLAGIGPRRTRVRIIASPQVKRNIHEIEIESRAGSIFTRAENVLHPQNPKTSYLAVLSALSLLKQLVSNVRIGT